MVAACAKCQLKFFAPATFAGNPEGAEEFLACKFDVHGCPAEIGETERQAHRARDLSSSRAVVFLRLCLGGWFE